MSAAPTVKGWCPGAYRPMMSGDGLILRVRPRLARLTAAQAEGLSALALRHGNGFVDLTSRANLQIRGVDPAAHETVLEGLAGLGLLDPDPATEARRNLLVAPFWEPGDLTHRLAEAVTEALPLLPDLPAKVGIAVDAGAERLLAEAPADFRIERGADGLLLRADGAARGRPVGEETAIPALVEMAAWFDRHRTPDRRRMAAVAGALPGAWQTAPPVAAAHRPEPGRHALGTLLGAAFGQIDARALATLVARSGAAALRVTPWRMLLVEGAAFDRADGFIDRPGDPLLAADACPGAPFCPSASVKTRDIARRLAAAGGGELHVSGCSKGCARARPAAVTLVGRDGLFDLVENGCAWDAPSRTGLSPETLTAGGA